MTPIIKQTIAIIGAGSDMGSDVAKKVAGGNYRLLLFDDNVEPLQLLTEEIRQDYPDADLEIKDCPRDLCWEADIIILAVPNEVQKSIAGKIRPVATQKIVVSLLNFTNGTFGRSSPIQTAVGIRKLREWLPHSKIIRALKLFPPEDGNEAALSENRTNIYLSGDHLTALDTIFEMTKNAGFNPVITDSSMDER